MYNEVVLMLVRDHKEALLAQAVRMGNQELVGRINDHTEAVRTSAGTLSVSASTSQSSGYKVSINSKFHDAPDDPDGLSNSKSVHQLVENLLKCIDIHLVVPHRHTGQSFTIYNKKEIVGELTSTQNNSILVLFHFFLSFCWYRFNCLN